MADTQERYRVPKRLVPVRVRLTTGRQLPAHVQCAEFAENRLGRERVKDVFNGGETLVPLWNEQSQTTTLVNKRFVELVELVEPDLALDGEPDLTVHRAVTLLLSSGSGLRGTLLISTPPAHERTLDFLNRGERFFYLETESGTLVVNLEHVVTATDLEPRGLSSAPPPRDER